MSGALAKSPVVRLGVVSDTHGQVAYCREAIRLLESLEVDVVLHCGDVGSEAILELFEAWPTHFVWGNVDGELERRWRTQEGPPRAVLHGRRAELELAGVRIALLHGDDSRLLHETIHGGNWDLVCHGHTHQYRWEQVGCTWVLNPGALYRARPHTLAVLELPALDVTRVVL